MASGEKIYVGNGKEHVFQDGGKQIKIRLCLDGLKELHEKYGFTSDAGKHFLTIIVNERREKDTYGNTHSVTVDTWKPDSARSGNNTNKDSERSNNSAPQENQAPETPPDFPDDIPF